MREPPPDAASQGPRLSSSAGAAEPASISVVLPAFDEELNIEPVVRRCLEALPAMTDDFEVIVVDDGSRDGTRAIVQALVDEAHPRVRLLAHDGNRGYGAAIRTGLQHSGKDLVFYTDADRQFDIAELVYFLPMMHDLDLVVGFRVYRYDTVLRSIISWVYNRIVRILFRVRVRDVDCAYKLMRAEVRDKLSLQTDDFFIDTEIVARARKWNFRIGEKGVRHYPRVAGETTVAPGDVVRTLRTIVRMWRRIYVPSASQRAETDEIAEQIVATELLPKAGST